MKKYARDTIKSRLLAVLLFAVGTVMANEPGVPVAGLEGFPDGRWKGCHTVYTHPFFDATFRQDGMLWVQPKDAQGQPVGKAFIAARITPRCVTKDNIKTQRPPISFADAGQPVLWEATGRASDKPHVIHLRGMLTNNIPFEVQYEFNGNQITMAGGCADPQGLEPPTFFRLRTDHYPSHDIKANVEKAEREKLLKDCSMTVRKVLNNSKKILTYRYSDAIADFNGVSFESAEIRGVYSPRIIQIKAGGHIKALAGAIYEGNCLWQGFSLLCQTDGKKIDLKQNKMILTIK